MMTEAIPEHEPIPCGCVPTCRDDLRVATLLDRRVEIIIDSHRQEPSDSVVLDAAALRQHIAQCVQALAEVDPGDVAATTDLEQLRLRYYTLDLAALRYSEERDRVAAKAAELRRVLGKHEQTIAGYGRASESHLPEVRAALTGEAGQDLLSVAGAAARLVAVVPELPAGAVFLSSAWQELVAAVQRRAGKEPA